MKLGYCLLLLTLGLITACSKKDAQFA